MYKQSHLGDIIKITITALILWFNLITDNDQQPNKVSHCKTAF